MITFKNRNLNFIFWHLLVILLLSFVGNGHYKTEVYSSNLHHNNFGAVTSVENAKSHFLSQEIRHDIPWLPGNLPLERSRVDEESTEKGGDERDILFYIFRFPSFDSALSATLDKHRVDFLPNHLSTPLYLLYNCWRTFLLSKY